MFLNCEINCHGNILLCGLLYRPFETMTSRTIYIVRGQFVAKNVCSIVQYCFESTAMANLFS